jgi:hypothetical protein
MDRLDPMNTQDSRDAALDAALTRALPRPRLPDGFHARLRACVARDADVLRRDLRQRVDGEWRVLSAELARTRRRISVTTAGALVVGTLVPAAAFLAAMPWAQSAFGDRGLPLLAMTGTLIGLAIAGASAAGSLPRVD